MINVSDADYNHAKRVWEDFEIKILGEYHDFYVQRCVLLLIDLLGSFRNKCIEIYEFNPALYFQHQD